MHVIVDQLSRASFKAAYAASGQSNDECELIISFHGVGGLSSTYAIYCRNPPFTMALSFKEEQMEMTSPSDIDTITVGSHLAAASGLSFSAFPLQATDDIRACSIDLHIATVHSLITV